MRYVVLLGRVLYSLMFLMTAFGHFSGGYVGYAAQAGVPMPGVLVPLSGVIAIAGGLSIALGYKTKLGAWLVVIFLVPVTFMMHRFWTVTDPVMAGIQLANFFKNLSMLGAAFLIAYFGAGPLSLDARGSAPAAPAPAMRV